jgi:hypothetical protein
MRFVVLAALLLCGRAYAAGQVTIADGYRAMYNLQFDEAHGIFAKWRERHPDDPFAYVSDAAAYLFAELDRLRILQAEFFLEDRGFDKNVKADPEIKQKFEEAVTKGEALAQAALKRSPTDTNALFAMTMAQGLRADYHGLIEKRYLPSVKAMKEGRAYAQRLLQIDPHFGDAYLAIGVENYVLSQKPMPVRWFLKLYGSETDAERGVEHVKLCIEHGRYMKPFARLLLAVVAIREKNFDHARQILHSLAREFPKNPLYAEQANKLPK